MLILLIAPVALAGMVMYASYKRKRAIEVFGDPAVISALLGSVSAFRRRLKWGLLALVWALIAISLARPQVGAGLREVKRTGRDIIFALDVSKSMLARDATPSRLHVAKREISRMLQMLEGDRVGLVVYAGEGFLQCPLTMDYSAMRLFLDIARIGIVPKPGTNITEAIQTATEAFKRAESENRIIVLFSDGESHDDKPEEAAKKAREEGIKIYTVGVGTPAGQPIPIPDANGNIVYKKDSSGEPILSRLDEDTLRKIALETGGKYYFASQTEAKKDIELLFRDISGTEKGLIKDQYFVLYDDRYQWLLIPAILLLAFEAIIGERKRTGKGQK